MTQLLSRPAYDRAVHYLRHEARPLEKALYEFHFENGRRTNVLAALVPYQNPDGGFGHALEPDLRAPASSVIATITALHVMRQIRADEDTPGLPAALAYLMDAYDVDSERWPIVPPEVEDAPHAPWWNYADASDNFRGFWANPRAAVLAYLQQFNRLAPTEFLAGARRAAVDDLMRYAQHMEMHDLLSFIVLMETAELPREDFENVLDKLRRALPQSVALDATEWDGYGLPPLDAVTSPASPLAEVIPPEIIDANLDYIINQQGADGAWSPNWSWDFIDAGAWAAADREWRGILTLRKLQTLRAFGRLEGHE